MFNINAKGRASIAAQNKALTGHELIDGSAIENHFEEDRARGDSLECEISASKTLSEKPEFIQLDDEDFDEVDA